MLCNIVYIQGLRGYTGSRGPKGEMGLGFEGSKGDKGIKGERGPPGLISTPPGDFARNYKIDTAGPKGDPGPKGEPVGWQTLLNIRYKIKVFTF